MQLLIDKISKLNIGWNERSLNDADVQTLCQRLGVEIDETPMTVDGFYFRVMERDFIAVNSRLGKIERLAVLFHEIGHLLFHAPGTGPVARFHHVGRKTRQEIEADVFSLCALIPQTWVKTRSAEELIGDHGLSAEMIRERFAIFETFGI